MRPILTTLAVLLLTCHLDAPAATEESKQGAIDSIFAPLTDRKSPGAAVLVRKDGRNVFLRGYGVAELRTLAQIDAQTNFRLASFTKQFTAMAIMLLVRDGKLGYEQRLTDIFPDFPAYGRAITVRHLLTHTSGLPDYESLMEEVEKIKGPIWSPSHQIQDEEVLSLLKRQTKPAFAAGKGWAYSNSGYVVLGLMVAKVSREPFPQFLQHRVFQPLQMRNTLAYVNENHMVPKRAFGHTRKENVFVQTDQSSTSATLGDGGIYSNLEDLAQWDGALQKHSLLDVREMNVALRPATLADGSETRWPLEPGGDNLNPGKPVSYGFGWFLDPYLGHERMWHAGTTTGFRSVIQRFTKENLTVIVLCNRTDLDASKLALQVAGVVLKEP